MNSLKTSSASPRYLNDDCWNHIKSFIDLNPNVREFNHRVELREQIMNCQEQMAEHLGLPKETLEDKINKLIKR